MPTLHLALLGPIQIRLDDEPVTAITSPKILALLAYLGVEQGRDHSREALAELLWPEQPTGLQNLRQSLSRLRRALPQAEHAAPFLLSTRRTIQFNPDGDHQVDVMAFTAAVKAARGHNHAAIQQCADCLQSLERAAASYRGDFLAGLDAESPGFEAWVRPQQAWLHREALWALDALTRHALDDADLPRALTFARRQLALDPLREEAHCQVMSALMRAGQRSEALAQYDLLVENLRSELDVAPTPETTAFFNELRRNGAQPTQQASTHLRSNHPPSPARPTRSHNLPRQFTPFIGRDDLLASIQQRLERTECRLLTLVGTGGAGKTRLAVEAARRRLSIHRDGVCFVDLSGLDHEDQLPAAMAEALSLVLPPHARTEDERRSALTRLLHERDLLLVLDNYEHLLPHTALVTDLLHDTPVTLLVTSRTPLHLRAEWLIDVDGLPYPPQDAPPDQLTPADYPALALFHQTALRVKHDLVLAETEWRIIGRICRLVQGTPLALELAAAQVRDWPLAAMLDAIQADLDFLSTGMADVPPRHRSLRAVIDHSWQLMSAEEQAVYARLSAFRGSFSVAAAQSIVGTSEAMLDQLAQHSLLSRVDHGRYALHDSLRHFADEQMARFPSAHLITRRRHAIYYLELMADQADRLLSRHTLAAQAQIRPEFDNVRTAWAWAISQADAGLIARSLTGLCRYLGAAGLTQEGVQAIDTALVRLTGSDPAEAHPNGADARLQAQLLAKKARFLNTQGQYGLAAEAARSATESLAHAGPAASPSPSDARRAIAAEAWLQKGRAALHQGRYTEATGDLEEALGEALAAGDVQVEAEIHLNLGTIYNLQNEFGVATAHALAALELSRTGQDRFAEGIALNNLGAIAEFQGEYDRAAAYFEEALALFDEVAYRRGSANALSNLGAIAAWRGELGLALERHEQALSATRRLGDIDGEAWALMALGAVYTHRGQWAVARNHLQGALDLNRIDGTRTLEAWVLNHLAEVALAEEKLDEAEMLAEQASEVAQDLGDELTVAVALVVEGEVATRRGLFDQAEAVLARSLEINRDAAHEAGQLRVLTAQARLALARQDAAKASALAEEALALDAATTVILDRVQLLRVLGQAKKEQGNLKDAQALLEEALELHRRMGQDHLAHAVQTELVKVRLAIR